MRDVPQAILLYNDQIKNNFVIRDSLQNFCLDNAFQYISITALDVLSDRLMDHPDGLLVMPGGESKHYSSQLGQKGKQKLHDFVTKGGKYLGICAGAAAGLQEVDWFDELTGEKIDTRTTHKHFAPFGFLSATARGPVHDLVKDTMQQTQSYLSLVKLELCLPNSKKMDTPAVYMAGPSFEGIEYIVKNDKSVSILGQINNGKGVSMPAIIAKEEGKGRIILSSIHPEISGDNLLDKRFFKFKKNQISMDVHLKQCSHELIKYDKHRQNVYHALLRYGLAGTNAAPHKIELIP